VSPPTLERSQEPGREHGRARAGVGLIARKQIRLRHFLTALAVLLTAACTDSPTAPAVNAEGSRASEHVTYYPGTGECDPWMNLDWCEGRDPGDCMTSAPSTGEPEEYVGVQGCGGGGAPGGGGTPTDPPPPSPDTCNTGDPIVDDRQVTEGLASLWAQSNPDANLYSRVEKAGWIVEYPAGQFSIMQFTGTERFGCGDYRNVPMPAQGTVVGFVHTHPYQVGENIVDCSLRSVQTYDGTPSDVDRKTSVALGNHFGLGRPLPGYIIDKDGYYRYDGQGNTAAPRRARCGY